MIDCGSIDLAQARLQARHGQRLDDKAWRRIEITRDFAPLLEGARATALRPWLVGLTAASDGHAVETALRGHWQAVVAEAAGWMAAEWRPAVLWCAVLPDLAALQHLARGGEAPAWMSDAAAWRAQAQSAALATAWLPPHDVGAAWQAEWHRLWPPMAHAERATLLQFEQLLADHRQAFARAAEAQGWPLRGALHARLGLLLRRVALQPAALFTHLALCALDLERLRAELLRRAFFPRWKAA